MLIRPWLKALRPLAHGNLLGPFVIGLLFAYQDGFHASYRALIFGELWLWGVQATVLFMNDWADRHSDKADEPKTLVSGGSGVIQSGELSDKSLLFAWIGAAIALHILVFIAANSETRMQLLLCTSIGVALNMLYNLPPLQLSHRFGGEFLQALGVGVILPCAACLSLGAKLNSIPLPWLVWSFFLALVGHALTAIPDLDKDQRVDKRTIAVRIGASKIHYTVILSLVLAQLSLGAISEFATSKLWLKLSALPVMVIAVYLLKRDRMLSRSQFSPGLSLLLIYLLLWQLALNLSVIAVLLSYH